MSGKTNRRRESRRTVHLGEGIKVFLKDDSEVHSVKGEATDLSPWGMNVLIVDQKLSTYPKLDDIVRIHYTIQEKINTYVKGKIANISNLTIDDKMYLRFGISFIIDQPKVTDPNIQMKRFEVPEIFGPHAWCNDPFFFQEKLLFKVISFYANGMYLVTSARNKTLIPNLPLTLKMYLPFQGEFEVHIKIINTESSNTTNLIDRYAVNVEFTNINNAFMQMMVEYILFCGVDVTPQELRNEKLPVSIIEKSLTFYYASEDETAKIMELRKTSLFEEIEISTEAFIKVGDTLVENPYGGLQDKFDTFSRHVICKVGKKAVATLRIIFNNKDKSRCEIASYIINMPDWLWSKKFVEISRFAWEKDYRESDIFINMIRHVVRIVLESGHTHILTSAPVALKQLYMRVGFQPVQLAWKSETNEKKSKETPLMLDAKGILSKEVVIDKFIWNKIYSTIAKHLGFSK
ncbi:GNAT family N-acyltransferase [Fluviispira multicolorata]|uniref:GNAT family N-acetyltransferase n=1 Tax=Fluviispira multicolorata TaxID=2654512 RepID=A0A833N4C1_9BACT|nr:GNAT family N-acyltransferase [Fluviispira multicolorata]KAB8031881.1 GNAT family N-acetyltransferase [Fluviispira multicolorata]